MPLILEHIWHQGNEILRQPIVKFNPRSLERVCHRMRGLYHSAVNLVSEVLAVRLAVTSEEEEALT